jgi:parallel beta-helix repeat protein
MPPARLLPFLFLSGCALALQGAEYAVVVDRDSGSGTLRQAILSANANPGRDRIVGDPRIVTHPTSPLPHITDSVEMVLIAVDGASAGASEGLVFTAAENDVDAVWVTNFSGNGIVVRGPGKNRFTNLRIGSTTTGAFGGNGGHGLVIEGTAGDVFGGNRTSPTGGNSSTNSVIVGSGGWGVTMSNVTGMRFSFAHVGITTGRVVSANAAGGIQVNNSTNVRLGPDDPSNYWSNVSGNGGNGIELVDVTRSTIVSTALGIDNYDRRSDGNAGHGVVIDGGGENTVYGVRIFGHGGSGVLLRRTSKNIVRGVTAIENAGDGIRFIDADENDLGAAEWYNANGLRENAGDGIAILEGSRANRIINNGAYGNGGAGLRISDSSDNVFAVPNFFVRQRNSFVRNQHGIVISGAASGNLVQGAAIGDDDDNRTPNGNLGAGILITGGASGNVVGTQESANSFTSNSGPAIAIESGTGNGIGRNDFHLNGGLPIDLGNDGMTWNDPLDADRGPNERQNAPRPVVAYQSFDGAVDGVLQSRPNTTYVIQTFLEYDRSAIRAMNTATVTTDPNGFAAIHIPFTTPGSQAINAHFYMTATDPQGNTSELSERVRVREPGPVYFDSASYRVREDAGTATFTIVRAGPPDWAGSVKYRTVDGTATAGSDYAASTGTVTFQPGESRKTITIPITKDSVDDANETFRLELFDTTGQLSFYEGTPFRATVTIVNAVAELTVADVRLFEGDGLGAATIVVRSSVISATPVRVDYRTVNGTAVAGEDFAAVSGTLEIPAGQMSALFTVPIRGDIAVEGDEQFTVLLAPTPTAAIADGEAAVSIRNDDGVPVITADDVVAVEGGAVVVLRRSGLNGRPSELNIRTSDGTASDRDYDASEKSVRFGPDEVQKTVFIHVRTDDIAESPETFLVDLTHPENAILARERVLVTITDDPADTRIVADAVDLFVEEGSSARDVEMIVRLSKASTVEEIVEFKVDATEAVRGEDFEGPPATGTLTFAPGEREKRLPFRILGDTQAERGERVQVELTHRGEPSYGHLTIVNDDGPALRVQDARIVEDTLGSNEVKVRITLDAPSAEDVHFEYSVHYGTARDEDLLMSPRYDFRTIPAGATGITISIDTLNTDDGEAPEFFTVEVRDASFARIERSEGVVTVIDAAPLPSAPLISVRPIAEEEPASGVSEARFALELSRPFDGWVVVDVETTAGTATSADFFGHAERVVFEPGETRQFVTVAVAGDGLSEGKEWFFLVLRNVSNAILATPVGVATIYDPGQQPQRSRRVRR